MSFEREFGEILGLEHKKKNKKTEREEGQEFRD